MTLTAEQSTVVAVVRDRVPAMNAEELKNLAGLLAFAAAKEPTLV